MKIAIIGGGISGITCAHHLQHKHAVTIFEANDYLGGHTDTHTVQMGGKRFPVDSGFIVFNQHNYPKFTQFLNDLEVESQPSNMSFSVDNSSLNLVYGADGFKRLFSQPLNVFKPTFYRMLLDIKRFYAHANQLQKDKDHRYTLGEHLAQHQYSTHFTEGHILPMVSALWSSSITDARTIPLQTILSFMANHRMLQFNDRPDWLTVKNGSSSYIKTFQQRFNGNLRLSTPVDRIERNKNYIKVHLDNNRSEAFDHVVMACHSDQALKLLLDPSEQETEILSAIPFEKNIATVHTDSTVMPRKKNAWSSWNVVVDDSHHQKCRVTYWMNELQSFKSDHPIFVSLNAKECIDPKKIITNRVYHHPQFTQQAIDAQHNRHEINGKLNTWYTGAYWGWGFHEDGVRSATSVVEALT